MIKNEMPVHIYIPIWFYSNPSSIIPYFPSFTRTIFVDPTFSLHFPRIFDKSLYQIFLFIPLYKTFVDPPGFLLYQRSTTILTAAVGRCFIGSASTGSTPFEKISILYIFLILPKKQKYILP